MTLKKFFATLAIGLIVTTGARMLANWDVQNLQEKKEQLIKDLTQRESAMLPVRISDYATMVSMSAQKDYINYVMVLDVETKEELVENLKSHGETLESYEEIFKEASHPSVACNQKDIVYLRDKVGSLGATVYWKTKSDEFLFATSTYCE